MFETPIELGVAMIAGFMLSKAYNRFIKVAEKEETLVTMAQCQALHSSCQASFCADLKMIRKVVLRLAIKQGIPVEEFERLAE